VLLFEILDGPFVIYWVFFEELGCPDIVR